MKALCNGIELPRAWPPVRDGLSREPMPAPWLERPPEVIPIDLGRQLFVDDFLVAESSLTRAYHLPRKFGGNPVLVPETPLEMKGGGQPVACPFSDGVWYDPRDGRFKMWYHAGWFDGTALALSDDGVHWSRPTLDVTPGTNRVLAPVSDWRRDGSTAWIDPHTSDPAERYKMYVYFRSEVDGNAGRTFTSGDGIHWSGPRTVNHVVGDNTTFFFNPFLGRWVFSINSSQKQFPDPHPACRTRNYWEDEDFLRAASWPDGKESFWVGADRLDEPDPYVGDAAQMYKVDAVAYESLLLGALLIHRGPENPTCDERGMPKLTEMTLAYSRDGFHWHRPDRRAFIHAERNDRPWDRAYVHSAGGVCLVVGDELWFYYGAWSGRSPKQGRQMYAGGATGIAILRRDGFASLDAGPEGGELTTRPVVFRGNRLFVNVSNLHGELRVAVLDQGGKPINGLAAGECLPIGVDSTCAEVRWTSNADLGAVAGQPVRLRFALRAGSLFSFWVTDDPAGASYGYVAAGGPGFAGDRDLPRGGRDRYVGDLTLPHQWK